MSYANRIIWKLLSETLCYVIFFAAELSAVTDEPSARLCLCPMQQYIPASASQTNHKNIAVWQALHKDDLMRSYACLL